jgi:hypothetical protein
MKISGKKLKKILLVSGISIIAAVTLVILFISPIALYLIEKYSVKYTGRQIKMDWAYINPFTAYAHFGNLKIYESKSDSIFLSAEGFSISFSLHKLLSNKLEISSITLDKPRGIAIQETKHVFNFSDVIERFFSPTHDSTGVSKHPLHFSMLNLKINDGTFYLRDTVIHINYFIKDFNFSSSGKRWDADTLPGTFSFSPGIGTGHIKGNFTINTSNLNYRFAFTIQNLDLFIIEQYLKDLTNYGSFSACLEAGINATGNFKDAEKTDARGRVSINHFHFGKNNAEDYFSFDTLALNVNEINPKEHLYNVDSLTLVHPFFKYEKYDYLDNVETMFGKNGSKAEAATTNPEKFNLILTLGHFFANLSKNFFQSEYKVNALALKYGYIQFNDYSTNEKFSIDAYPLYISGDSLNKTRKKIDLSLKSGIKPYGDASVNASVYPMDSVSFM